MREITLVVETNGHSERHAVQVDGPPITIGRNPDSDIALADKRVSWAHARLAFQDGQVTVRDMGSRNGTTVDGAAVQGMRVVPLGSTVRVASVLRIRVEGPEGVARNPEAAWILDDLNTGLRKRLDGDIAIQPLDPSHPELVLSQKGEAWWLRGSGMAIEVEPGIPFQAGGRLLVLNNTAALDAGTVANEQITEITD